eukprot:scaffold2626_cov279-Pinguiococcus_pyrenoidosus.AAC.8
MPLAKVVQQPLLYTLCTLLGTFVEDHGRERSLLHRGAEGPPIRAPAGVNGRGPFLLRHGHRLGILEHFGKAIGIPSKGRKSQSLPGNARSHVHGLMFPFALHEEEAIAIEDVVPSRSRDEVNRQVLACAQQW